MDAISDLVENGLAKVGGWIEVLVGKTKSTQQQVFLLSESLDGVLSEPLDESSCCLPMTGCPILLLPPELMGRVCLRLPSWSIAALELASPALRSSLALAGVWADRARRVDKAKSYSFVTRVLHYADRTGLDDQRLFKAVLGLRRVIREASYGFHQQCFLNTTQLYKNSGESGLFKAAQHKFMSKKMSQIKAWSSDLLEEKSDYEKLVEHEKFCDEFFKEGDHELDVASCLGRMREEAASRFSFDLWETAEGIERECALINHRYRVL